MKIYVVVNNPQSWPLDIPGVEVVSAKTYLTNSEYSSQRNAKVFNLCRSYRYQTTGYYVSLLAAARGHKPLPSVQTIQDLKSPTMTKLVSDELEELIQNSLQHIQSSKFTLSIYFGRNVSKCHERLSQRLFQQFQAPLLLAQFQKNEERWQLQNISPMIASDIPADHRDFVVFAAKEHLTKKRGNLKKKMLCFDLAILHNPDDPNSPSNEKALQKFLKAAEISGFDAELITKDDYSRIAEFDALFIRETTAVNHHTYRFARRALAEGLVVIDDPDSILKCTNKVFLAEALERHKINAPKTIILHSDNIDQVAKNLGFPCVLKQPDGAFSNGCLRVENEQQLDRMVPDLLEKSDLLIAQEFIPTQFDWRVTIFDGKPLYVCKYFMARKHWQIYERSGTGKTYTGKHETMPVSMAPKKVIRAALNAAELIGDGLYGVDIKETQDSCYVIEINDNPSIDAGVEDQVLEDELYLKIMQGMLQRVEMGKNGKFRHKS
ncbi:MAG TPA: RimK family protein [Chlamydiales bacterium]|nr:RimK family protein [Chlamydiales bacterium]